MHTHCALSILQMKEKEISIRGFFKDGTCDNLQVLRSKQENRYVDDDDDDDDSEWSNSASNSAKIDNGLHQGPHQSIDGGYKKTVMAIPLVAITET